MTPISASSIARQHELWTASWHSHDDQPPADEFLALVREQHRRNFDLWHEEDKARAPDATDTQIAAVKRRIDKLNQQRNDLIEKLDEHFFGLIQEQKASAPPGAPWNSETPGSVIDRLSILSLKV